MAARRRNNSKAEALLRVAMASEKFIGMEGAMFLRAELKFYGVATS
jgi:hypothetical protein